MEVPFGIDRFTVFARGPFRLADEPTRLGGIPVDRAKELIDDRAEWLGEFQKRLYADRQHRVLVLLHGADAAGKDGLIRTVFGKINPVGLDVACYRGPSPAGHARGVLADAVDAIPAIGRIGVMNRSFFETLMYERAVADRSDATIEWAERTKTIRDFESYLLRSGITVIKIFLHISRRVQRERLRSRFTEPHKRWKLTNDDLAAHRNFASHQSAFEQAIGDTASVDAPWYVIPADNKWIGRAVAAEAVARRLREVDAEYPPLNVDTQLAAEVLGLEANP